VELFDEKNEFNKLMEQIEEVQQQVDWLVEKDQRDNMSLFNQL